MCAHTHTTIYTHINSVHVWLVTLVGLMTSVLMKLMRTALTSLVLETKVRTTKGILIQVFFLFKVVCIDVRFYYYKTHFIPLLFANTNSRIISTICLRRQVLVNIFFKMLKNSCYIFYTLIVISSIRQKRSCFILITFYIIFFFLINASLFHKYFFLCQNCDFFFFFSSNMNISGPLSLKIVLKILNMPVQKPFRLLMISV